MYIFFLLDLIFSTLRLFGSLCNQLYVTGTAMKVSRYLYCFTTSISHGVENYKTISLAVGSRNL